MHAIKTKQIIMMIEIKRFLEEATGPVRTAEMGNELRHHPRVVLENLEGYLSCRVPP